MSVQESVLVVVFIMAVVFLVLILLSAVLKVFSKALAPLGKKNEVPILPIKEEALEQDEQDDEDFSSGALKLKNVDEHTAAMIMAIVSDESGIPLKELVFKSITLVEE